MQDNVYLWLVHDEVMPLINNVQDGGVAIRQNLEEDFRSIQPIAEDHSNSNRNFVIDADGLISVDPEKAWELVGGEERCE
jgi:hypothetical protein